jgi:hypothetical protein
MKRGSSVNEQREVLRREIDEAINRAEKGQRRKLETPSHAGGEDAGADEQTTGSGKEADRTAADEAVETADEKETSGDETIV